ncbi:MAG: TrkH family potassium uptake protein, partial [Deltaproteobacteria bacterium]|nr:TrkH family potassium uptake protein [Deltaproteobacteria bacterium]
MHEWKKIFYILSLFLFLFSFSFFLPFFISLVYAEKTWPAFAESFLITLFVSGLFYVFSYKQKDRELHSRDGFILVVFMWLFTILFSALPYLFCNTFLNFTDCFFESASGYTTTGASVLEHIELSPKGILFWRSLTQWLGGMGIIVLYIAILPMLGSGGIKLFSAEAPGVKLEKVRPRIKEMAKTLWLVYIFFTILEVILLLFGGMS